MKKFKKNGGFTLVEMLIVVAIIAILVAVSIPLVTSSLEKANVATDQANERAAKAAALIEYLNAETDGTMYFKYDSTTGKATQAGGTAWEYGDGCGKCSASSLGHSEKGLSVRVDENGATVKWGPANEQKSDTTGQIKAHAEG